jgi:peptide/nickel transport system permease protein
MIRMLVRTAKVRIGVGVLAFFVLMAAIGPWFAINVVGFTPTALDLFALAAPPAPPHWLGTTISGQDVLAQVISGAQQSMIAGVIATLLGNAIALVVGVTAGMAGGRLDTVLSGVTNVFLTLPGFALILIVAGYLQGGGTATIGILMGVFGWAGSARAIRAQTLTLRSRDFVTAMSGLGESRFRLAVSEIIPSLGGLLSSLLLMGFVGGVIGEAGFAYLGVTDGSAVSWGTMIADAQTQNALISGWWWWFLPPGICIILLGASVTLINFGVDELTNPRLRGESSKSLRRARQIRRNLLEGNH